METILRLLAVAATGGGLASLYAFLYSDHEPYQWMIALGLWAAAVYIWRGANKEAHKG